MKLAQVFRRNLPPRSNLLKAAALIAVCVPLGMVVPRILTISTTPSLGDRVFLFNVVDVYKGVHSSDIQSGDTVRFPFADAVTGGHTVYMLKRVACTSGQRLQVNKQKDYYCDDRYLGHAKSVSAKGASVKNFEFDGIIPEGKFFALADHKDSYDSRYYGLIDLDRVVARAYPLF